METRKYNSVVTYSFSIDHNSLDGSDITPGDVVDALLCSYESAQDAYDRVTECRGGQDLFQFEDTIVQLEAA